MYFPEFNEMLKRGETGCMLALADRLLGEQNLTAEQKSELHTAKAWAFCRQKDYASAKMEAKLAGKHPYALECLYHIAGIQGEEDKVEKYHACLLGSILADNAWIVAARQKESAVTHEEVLAIALKWLGDGIIADQVYTANVANNTARFFLAKPRNIGDLETALRFMKTAVSLYGEGDINLHHRASANFWLSNISERLGNKNKSIGYAKISIRLWKRQLGFDPTNPNFLNSFEGAKKRLKELKKEQKQS